MEKLTSILAVVPEGGAQGVLLDKVVRIVRQTGARIELFLTAPSDYFSVAAHVRALDCDVPTAFTLYDGDAPLTDAILSRAAAVQADLLIAPRGHLKLEHCSIPQLLLGKTPWAHDARFAAAVDVAEDDSESVARGILNAGGFLAQRCAAHLDILYSERELADQRVRLERAVKLARLVREYHVGCERLQVFDGMPERVLPPLIAARRYDLLMLGAVPRHHTLLAEYRSVSRHLAGSSDGDLLLVEPRAQPAADVRAPSAGEQLAHQA